MDNAYSYMGALGEASQDNSVIQSKINTTRQRFESDKSSDISAHILLNGVMHEPIKKTVEYLGGRAKTYAQNKITNGLKTLKNKALTKYNENVNKLKNALPEEKDGIQQQINGSLKKLKQAQQNLSQKIQSKPENNSEPVQGPENQKVLEPAYEREITPGFEREVTPGFEREITPAFEREITPARKVITQDAKPEISQTVDKPHLARSQPNETDNLNNVSTSDELTSVKNRITTRYNNLDGSAQKSSDTAYNAVKQGGKFEDQTLKQQVSDAKLREESVNLEENNPFTSFKNPDLQIQENENITPDNNIFGRITRQRNQDSYNNPSEQETTITQQAQPEESLTIPARTESVPAVTESVPAVTETVPAVTETVPAVTESTPVEAVESTGGSVGKKVSRMFEKDAVEGAEESAVDPLALVGQLIVGAITTLPSILKKQKNVAPAQFVNPSSGMNIGEI